MSLYKPSELKAFLLEHHKKAKKSLSQNFLIDKNILDKIITYNTAYKHLPVLEIGPGPGALTEQLLLSGFTVMACELDDQFAKILTQRLTPAYPHFKLIHADFLQLDLEALPKSSVIANLPYHITTKVLIKLLLHAHKFTSLTLMVQREFFIRIQQLEGKEYGIINILARLLSTRLEGFKVSASCFYPAPRVESAVLYMELNCSHSSETLRAFYTFLKECFMCRRKKLLSNLAAHYPPAILKKAFEHYQLKEDLRVEAISPQLYFELYSFLSASSC